MSFKRDGDDSGLLNNLRKHLVADLLSHHIPEDEAILMTNGRYSCAVCSNRPVFDTLSVMAVHRKGKKHLSYLTRRLAKQEENRAMLAKRLQLEQSKFEETQNSILATPLHSSCKKKLMTAKKTPYSRKQTLVLVEKANKKQKSESTTATTAMLSSHSVVRNYLKTIQKKKSFSDFVEKSRQQPTRQLKPQQLVMEQSTFQTFVNPTQNSKKKPEEKSRPNTNVDDPQRKEAEHYLNIREKGWIRDSNGNWVREDGAEFDSDDEPPGD